jgi:hypothetical protein
MVRRPSKVKRLPIPEPSHYKPLEPQTDTSGNFTNNSNSPVVIIGSDNGNGSTLPGGAADITLFAVQTAELAIIDSVVVHIPATNNAPIIVTLPRKMLVLPGHIFHVFDNTLTVFNLQAIECQTLDDALALLK